MSWNVQLGSAVLGHHSKQWMYTLASIMYGSTFKVLTPPASRGDLISSRGVLNNQGLHILSVCVQRKNSVSPQSRATLEHFSPSRCSGWGAAGRVYTVCHCSPRTSSFSDPAPEPSSGETNVSHLMFLWGFYSNCLVDQPHKRPQMLNSQRTKPYAFIAAWWTSSTNQKGGTVGISRRERERAGKIHQGSVGVTQRENHLSVLAETDG